MKWPSKKRARTLGYQFPDRPRDERAREAARGNQWEPSRQSYAKVTFTSEETAAQIASLTASLHGAVASIREVSADRDRLAAVTPRDLGAPWLTGVLAGSATFPNGQQVEWETRVDLTAWRLTGVVATSADQQQAVVQAVNDWLLGMPGAQDNPDDPDKAH